MKLVKIERKHSTPFKTPRNSVQILSMCKVQNLYKFGIIFDLFPLFRGDKNGTIRDHKPRLRHEKVIVVFLIMIIV